MQVVEECRSFPSTVQEILDAASIAEEFQDLFPKAAEAVLETCTSELQQRLTAPQHFIQFASEHSTDPVRSGTAFRLLARLKKEEGPRIAPYTSGVTPSKVKESKQVKEIKCKEIINCENSSPQKTGTLCSNCSQDPCLDRQSVTDIEKVTNGCQLLTVQGDYLGTVVKIHPEWGRLRMERGGISRNFSLQTKAKHAIFNYHCEGAQMESSPSTGPQVSKPNKRSQCLPPPFTCTNCRQSPCLHNKPVLDTKKLPVGCRLLSASDGYFKGAAPTVATVVAVDQLGISNPLRVAWPRGGGQNCPIPTKAKHTPTFTYFCTEDW